MPAPWAKIVAGRSKRPVPIAQIHDILPSVVTDRQVQIAVSVHIACNNLEGPITARPKVLGCVAEHRRPTAGCRHKLKHFRRRQRLRAPILQARRQGHAQQLSRCEVSSGIEGQGRRAAAGVGSVLVGAGGASG